MHVHLIFAAMRLVVATLTLTLLLITALAGCSPRRAPQESDEPVVEVPEEAEEVPEETPEPPAPPPVPEEDTAPPPPEPPEPEVDYLYVRTEGDLRQAFSDALFSLFRIELAPSGLERLTIEEVRAWLADHDEVDPEAVAYAREQLGEVLDQRFTVGFVAHDVVDARCARYSDILFVPVPDRYQTSDRQYDGLIVKDECVSEGNPLCLLCSGGRGDTLDGTPCSCVCVPSSCPGTDCVSC